MYFLDRGTPDENRRQWCKDNRIFYINVCMLIFPITIFDIVMPEGMLEEKLNKIVLFNKTNAAAYKLRWL